MHETPSYQTWQRGDYEISTDPARLDMDVTHKFLSEEAYWSPGVPREIVERAIGNSMVFGVYLPAPYARIDSGLWQKRSTLS